MIRIKHKMIKKINNIIKNKKTLFDLGFTLFLQEKFDIMNDIF